MSFDLKQVAQCLRTSASSACKQTPGPLGATIWLTPFLPSGIQDMTHLFPVTSPLCSSCLGFLPVWLLPLSLRNMSLLVLKLWGERTFGTPRFWGASAMLSDLQEGRPCWRTGWHSDHPENIGSEKRIQHHCFRIQRINRNPRVNLSPAPPPQVMLVVKICLPMQEMQERVSIPGSGRSLGVGKWQSTIVFLPGKFHR